MALFGFGKSKSVSTSNAEQEAQSESQSSSFNNSDSLSRGLSQSTSGSVSGGYSVGGSESVGGGYSTGQSTSVGGGTSLTGSSSSSTQGIAFEDIFAKLYGGATNTAFGLDPSALITQANNLFTSGTGFLDQLGGGPETDYLSSRVSGESPVLQQQIDALGSDLGRFFTEQLNPAITSQGVATGTLGGGRQGVAQGAAADSVARQYAQGVTDLRARDIAARDAAAQNLAANRLQGAGIGLSSLPVLSGIAQQGYGAALDPYVTLASILGGPTTLTQAGSSSFGTSEDFSRAQSTSAAEDFSRASSFSTAEDFARAFSQAFAEDFAASTTRGGSQSTSSSKSKSTAVSNSKTKQFNFDLGFGG